jgi:hypothetical protein
VETIGKYLRFREIEKGVLLYGKFEREDIEKL